jgi:nucleotide-binding universal stress UspA family protein
MPGGGKAAQVLYNTLNKSSTLSAEDRMARAQGPIVFLTSGSAESLAALPGLAAFAAALDRQLAIVHMSDSSEQAPSERLSAALAALPSSSARTGVYAAQPDAIHTVIETLAAAAGGMLALLPKRPRSIERFLVGNEYERLLRTGPLPVLALPASGQIARPARVLFPADLSPRSAAAFDEACALCQSLDADLHLLHVFGDDRLLPSEIDQERRAAARNPRELLAIDQGRLRALVDQAAAQGVRASTHTAEGRAHEQIPGYAASAAIDLIVMPSHGPRSVEDILRGSTTVRVIQQAQVAVLAMRA